MEIQLDQEYVNNLPIIILECNEKKSPVRYDAATDTIYELASNGYSWTGRYCPYTKMQEIDCGIDVVKKASEPITASAVKEAQAAAPNTPVQTQKLSQEMLIKIGIVAAAAGLFFFVIPTIINVIKLLINGGY